MVVVVVPLPTSYTSNEHAPARKRDDDHTIAATTSNTALLISSTCFVLVLIINQQKDLGDDTEQDTQLPKQEFTTAVATTVVFVSPTIAAAVVGESPNNTHKKPRMDHSVSWRFQ
eukprot:scaffold869_cov150-Cylindrotheca_fusiformis.AAC.6